MFPFPEALGQKRGDALGGVPVCVLVGQLRELQALGQQRIIARGELLEKRAEIVRRVEQGRAFAQPSSYAGLAAAAVIAATAIVAAAAAATAAAAAGEDQDDEDQDPQAAAAAKTTVIIAHKTNPL